MKTCLEQMKKNQLPFLKERNSESHFIHTQGCEKQGKLIFVVECLTEGCIQQGLLVVRIN